MAPFWLNSEVRTAVNYIRFGYSTGHSAAPMHRQNDPYATRSPINTDNNG